MTKPKVSQNADLADLPENAFATPGRAHYPSNYLALQNRVFTFTRLHLGGTDAQNDALGDARKQHLENAQLQAQIGKLDAEIQKMQQQKIKLSLERSLMPRLLSRLRHIRRTVRTEGLPNAIRFYLPVLTRKIRSTPIIAKSVSKVPLGLKQSAKSFVERQLVSLSAEINAALKDAAGQDFVLICNSFPGANQGYGGEFIRMRYAAYLEQGLSGSVIHLRRALSEGTQEPFEQTCYKVLRLPDAHIGAVSKILAQGHAKVLCHSPTPNVQKALQKHVTHTRLNYWFHGFDVRDYRRLYFNYSTAELAARKAALDEVMQWRKEANQICFGQPEITKIFVSNYLRNIAERDTEITAQNSHIIPNYINGDVFAGAPKRPKQMNRILMLRSFSQRNYGGDIAVEAIKIASRWEGFENLHFTVRGFGHDFASATADLWAFPNVDIQEQYSSVAEMAELHREHGVFMCPTRFDTQGVSLGEAMASGMVCITNKTTGIPEFIDDTCGLLLPADNPRSMAKALFHVQAHADEFCQRGANAAKRVRAQCGADQTILREISLIKGDAA